MAEKFPRPWKRGASTTDGEPIFDANGDLVMVVRSAFFEDSESLQKLIVAAVNNASKAKSKIEIAAGPELDRAVANVIGLMRSQWQPGGDELFVDPQYGSFATPKKFRPSTNLNDAFAAAEVAGLFTVKVDGPEVHLARTIDGQWEILVGGSEMGYLSREATPALAICAAILKESVKP